MDIFKRRRINGQWILTDCGNIQITSPMVYQCICCPWVTSIDLTGDTECFLSENDGMVDHRKGKH